MDIEPFFKAMRTNDNKMKKIIRKQQSFTQEQEEEIIKDQAGDVP